MKLEKIQQDFISAIFNEDRETALQHVSSDMNLDAEQRLGIYRGSVYGILTKALGGTYPVCKELLGEEFFDKMCDRFIDKHPPVSPFFSYYGEGLTDFLSTFEPVQSVPFIADIANLEWTRHKLWQESIPELFDFSQLAELTEVQQASLTFHLKNTVRLIQSDFRIDDIWFAHQADNDIHLENIDINQATSLLMWKSENSIKITDLSNEAEYFHFLKMINKKNNIAQLAENIEEQLPGLLNRAIQDGWIGSFTCN